MKLQELHPDSRLWLYQSNRELTATELQWLNEQLDTFSNEWAAHGKNLKAGGGAVNSFFIGLAVDSTHESASGCSIDSSVRFVKELAKELGVDFFNRLQIWSETEAEKVELVPFNTLSKHPESVVFNPMVDRLGDLETKFRIQANSLIS